MPLGLEPRIFEVLKKPGPHFSNVVDSALKLRINYNPQHRLALIKHAFRGLAHFRRKWPRLRQSPFLSRADYDSHCPPRPGAGKRTRKPDGQLGQVRKLEARTQGRWGQTRGSRGFGVAAGGESECLRFGAPRAVRGSSRRRERAALGSLEACGARLSRRAHAEVS